jgi:hypothetical protein
VIRITETAARKKWTQKNTTHITMKLQNSTDADIIEYLRTCDSKQGIIKKAIREHIARTTSEDRRTKT